MSRLVVDASVAAKWFFPEPESPAAFGILSKGSELLAPDLLPLELANVIWKRHQRGEINESEAAQIMADTSKVPMTLVETRALLPRAFDLAISIGRTVYDSTYLALALEIGVPLVTADLKFVRAVRAVSASFPILALEEV
jgi:predicted nucleic acid-binding protein